MKTLFRNTIIIIGCVLTLNCSNKVEISGNAEVIPINFNDYEQLSLKDLFSKIEVVELEGSTGSYLSDPSGFLVNDGKFFIRDRQSIFVFDSDGSFLYDTSKRNGRAKYEYISVNFFGVLDGDVGILDFDGKFIVYDSLLNIKALYVAPLDKVNYYSGFAQLSDDIIVLSSENINKSEIVWSFFSKSKGEIVKTSYANKVRSDGMSFGKSRLYYKNDSITLYRIKNNGYSLYELNPNTFTLSERYRYDVGKDIFLQSDVDESESVANYLVKHQSDYILLREALINNKYLIAKVGYLDGLKKNGIRLSIYSLKDGRQRLINNLFDNEKWISIDYLDDDCIYTYVNNYSNMNHLYEDDLLDEKSRRILKGVNNNTNSLVFKYYLKEDIL